MYDCIRVRNYCISAYVCRVSTTHLIISVRSCKHAMMQWRKSGWNSGDAGADTIGLMKARGGMWGGGNPPHRAGAWKGARPFPRKKSLEMACYAAF